MQATPPRRAGDNDMCGLGAIGIFVFLWIGLILAVIYGLCLWYAIRNFRRRRKR